MEKSHAREVREMFGRISPRYDLMNFLITGGQDVVWRNFLVRAAGVGKGSVVLDIGAGTGVVAKAAAKKAKLVVAADFTPEMVAAGAKKRPQALWAAADAMALPFSDASFDAVLSAYLLRNVSDPAAAAAEMVRVARPGGRVACLETTPPPPGPLAPFIRFHLDRVIPLLGQVVAGDREAYEYLPRTTQAFLKPQALARLFTEAGLANVRFRTFAFSTQVVAWGVKPG
ncbi:MAG: ubiquinone/menaquinone biosynthesis methyltransferase [Deltaproteobacteria bacterium]|nr:ubiquinone/menaquinone biosynthesis methyltransferase [Deltaproteobacteria bacterium]